MKGISTILWDVGGVLLTNGWDHKERNAVIKHFSLDRDAFEQRHSVVNDAWEKDRMNVHEYLDQTVFYEARHFKHDDFIAQMKAQSEVLADTGIRILKRIAASRDLELAIVNNESRELNDYRVREFGLIDCFDCFLSSCYVGMRKPDEKMYRLALDVLQRGPEEVIFIDDREGNVQAASAVGIHGIQFKGEQQLAAELAQLGIAVAA
jgi:putative hydrolase of the HAD superfamily